MMGGVCTVTHLGKNKATELIIALCVCVGFLHKQIHFSWPCAPSL